MTDPFAHFQAWMADAEASEPSDPNALTVVTTTPDGKPSARTILLKGTDPRGFVFYTNKESRKAGELAANANVFLLFYWKSLGRQIRIEGSVEHVTDAEAEIYYASREIPRRNHPSPTAWVGLPCHPNLFRVLAEYGIPPARPHDLPTDAGRRMEHGQAVSVTR